jgi:hypothetical protein
MSYKTVYVLLCSSDSENLNPTLHNINIQWTEDNLEREVLVL